MKYGNRTLGQVEAVFNKLGGDEGVERFLQGKLKVVEDEEVKNTLLESLGDVIVPATTERFVAGDNFVVDTSDKAKVKISYLGSNLKKWFLDKVEEPIKKTELRYDRLKERSVDEPIITELGGKTKAETTLTEIFLLMEAQKDGDCGVLLNDGCSNIFYVRDINGTLRAVSVGWVDGGWDVDAFFVGDPYEWVVGCRVFSRNS